MSVKFSDVTSQEMTQVEGGVSGFSTVQAMAFARAFNLNRIQTSLLVNYNQLIEVDPHTLVDNKIDGIDTTGGDPIKLS